jgi:YVTN family beta-propeller protein
VECALACGSIDADPVRDRAYAVNFGDASISIIDGKTDRVVGKIGVDYAPCKIAVDAERGLGYVANSLVSTLSVIDLEQEKVVHTIPVERAPIGVALGHRGDRLYAANRGAGSVSVIDRQNGKEWARVTVGTAPGDLAFDRKTSRIFVSDAGASTISVFADRLEGRPTKLPKEGRHPLVGLPLPEFRLPDMTSGQERTSGEWRGKPYILNFFASW